MLVFVVVHSNYTFTALRELCNLIPRSSWKVSPLQDTLLILTWVFCKVLDPLVLRISRSSESWQGLNPLIPGPTIQAVKSKISLFNSLISMIKNVSLLSWASKMPSFPFWNFFFFSTMKKELKMFNPENVPFSEAPKKRFYPTKRRLSSQPSHKKSVPNFFYSHFFFSKCLLFSL